VVSSESRSQRRKTTIYSRGEKVQAIKKGRKREREKALDLIRSGLLLEFLSLLFNLLLPLESVRLDTVQNWGQLLLRVIEDVLSALSDRNVGA